MDAAARAKPETQPQTRGHRGNKAALPSKACVTCGRTMSWRKAWAKNWAEVRHCSERCRRNKR